MSKLEQARKIINEVDAEMAALFEKRMMAAQLVAEYKRENGLSIFDSAREAEVIKKNSQYIENDTIREYYVQFLKDTMSISRSYQSRLNEGVRVAYNGVPGAYAYIAAKKMFPECVPVSYKDFQSAYESVERGECDIAVLPIENSYAGDVGIVMDLIFSGSLYVNQVIELPIVHNLMACKGATLDSVKKVISHPQALSQCAEFLQKRGYDSEAFANTAVSAQYVKEANDVTLGAIASEETANIFDLEILESNVNTSRSNTTRFAAFSRSQNAQSTEKSKMNDHFILTFTVKNEAGALAKTLDIIGAHGFNMRNLRSRPMKELLWSYYFYIEADGNINTRDGKEMLRILGATCDRLKLAGTYSTYVEK
ncbi:MAG: chorismate mutase [Clostridia bacterium]|nr:chorismate mutase [Clostridia bacterium]